jgi:hypothetical protein
MHLQNSKTFSTANSEFSLRLGKLRGYVLDSAEPLLMLLGALVGAVAATIHLTRGEASASAIWMKQAAGWEMDAFAAFASMSGFALAALALVASLSDHGRAKDVIDSNSGRYLLKCLISSVWWWLSAGLSALVDIPSGSRLSEAAFLLLAPLAVSRGFVALIAISLFFKRFTVTKPL